MFGRVGKVYNGTPKVKDIQRGSIKNLKDAAAEEQKKKKGAKS